MQVMLNRLYMQEALEHSMMDVKVSIDSLRSVVKNELGCGSTSNGNYEFQQVGDPNAFAMKSVPEDTLPFAVTATAEQLSDGALSQIGGLPQEHVGRLTNVHPHCCPS